VTRRARLRDLPRHGERPRRPVASAPAGATQFVDTTTVKGTKDFSVVHAYNEVLGPPSNELLVTALGPKQLPLFQLYEAYGTGSWPEAAADR
jgi:hypothetical protein